MKANEAPKKLYIDIKDGFRDSFLYGYVEKRREDDIEYIRTDAFIEKAMKFFTEKFEVEDYNDNIDIDGSPIFNYGRFIDDFKNYMEE